MILGLGMLNQLNARSGTERFEAQVGGRLLCRHDWGQWRVYTRGEMPPVPPAAEGYEEVVCGPRRRVRGGRLWSEQVSWASELGKRPPDLLVTLAFSPPLRHRVPAVMTVHDLTPLERPQDYTPAARAYWSAVLRRAAPRARRLATPSTWVKEECVRQLGFPAERIDVVYSGVRPRYFRREGAGATPLLARLGVAGRFWLHCGTVQPRKNLEVLVRALGLLRARGRELPWLVSVGARTRYADHLARVAAESGVSDRLVLSGPLDDEDLAALYAACDVFAYPSWAEGFGLPPLEAMAAGARVIAARTSCLPEVLGEAPHWADPATPESWIAAWDAAGQESIEAREQRARLGAERASSFTWEDTTKRMEGAIESALRELG